MDRKDAIDSLVKAVEEREYGDVLNHEEIGKIINRRYGYTEYRSILQAARKRLVAAGHMIINVRGVGYKVLNPDEYTREGIRCITDGARKIDTGTKIMSHAPVNDMTPQAREAHNRVNDRMLRLQAAMAGASVEIHMLGTSNNPLRVAK